MYPGSLFFVGKIGNWFNKKKKFRNISFIKNTARQVQIWLLKDFLYKSIFHKFGPIAGLKRKFFFFFFFVFERTRNFLFLICSCNKFNLPPRPVNRRASFTRPEVFSSFICFAAMSDLILIHITLKLASNIFEINQLQSPSARTFGALKFSFRFVQIWNLSLV